MHVYASSFSNCEWYKTSELAAHKVTLTVGVWPCCTSSTVPVEINIIYFGQEVLLGGLKKLRFVEVLSLYFMR